MRTREDLIAELIRSRIFYLQREIHSAEELSKPVTAGMWRLADHGRSKQEQKMDQLQAAARAAELRLELAVLQSD